MRRFILLFALFVMCGSVAFAQEDKITQGVVTTTTNTTYTTVTQTKQVRMSDEEWSEYKRLKREARRAEADSLHAVKLADIEQRRLARETFADSMHAVKLADIEQRRLAREERLANRPPLTGGVGWKNYANINLSGAVEAIGGIEHVSTPSIGIEYIGGKRFNRSIFLGFGTGIVFNTAVHSGVWYGNDFSYDEVIDNDKDLGLCVASFPLYANFRLYMASGKYQPYFSLSTGFRFSGKKSEKISYTSIVSGVHKDPIYTIKYGTTQYFLSPGFGIDFLGKSGRGISVQASLFAITRPWMSVYSYYDIDVTIHHSMVVGYHVQVGYTF